MGSFRKRAGMSAFLAGLLLGCQEISSPRCFTDCAHKSPGRTPDMKKLLGWELAGLPWRAQLDSSRKALAILKDSMHNSYEYRIPFQSWTGYRETTWVRVEHGALLERRFASWGFSADTSRRIAPLDSFAEWGAEVGRSAKGAKPRLLDSLYADCRRTLEAAGSGDSLSIRLDSNYVLGLCGYVPSGCMDDCFRGIRLEVFRWGD